MHYQNTKMNFNMIVSCKKGLESKFFFFALLLFWLKLFKDVDFVYMILDEWACVWVKNERKYMHFILKVFVIRCV
jgi:hypothetical protein